LPLPRRAATLRIDAGAVDAWIVDVGIVDAWIVDVGIVDTGIVGAGIGSRMRIAGMAA
jgi:hypothetical protein